MPTIFDNINQYLVKELHSTLAVAYRSDFCVGYFNLRGWKQLADHIDAWNGTEENRCRLLIGMAKLPRELIREYFALHEQTGIDIQAAIALKKRIIQEYKEQLAIGLPSEADETGLRKLSQQLKTQKVVIKLFLKHPLHAKLYLLFRHDPNLKLVGYLGSSNLTFSGLLQQGELNIDVVEQDAAKKLADWFENRWNDRWCLDISQELIAILDSSWAAERLTPPYHIYLNMAYHLSHEARAGLAEFRIPREFEHQLLEFQQKAVLIAAHHLNKRGGVIIGDVVGLGKTITATALARIFEDDFGLETLILCPKNLTSMWEGYVHKYRVRAKVLSISLVLRELPKLRRYRLVIIDESHNLRDREGKRYRAIQEYIQLNDSKVILLSATPYNKTYLDLSNQLRLFLPEDHDLGVSPERFIASIGGNVEFMARYNVAPRSIAAFEKSLFTDDWRELMRLYLVRRTRSFIKTYYAQTNPENGRKYLIFGDGATSYFPERVPKKVEYPFNPDDPADQYARLYSTEVVDLINHLNLPRYGLGNYVHEHPADTPTAPETIILANLSRAGKRLMGFNRTNLFKRLESSGYAFLLSVSRHILRNELFCYAIAHNLPLPIGAQEASLLDAVWDDEDLTPALSEREREQDSPLLSGEGPGVRLSQAEHLYAALQRKANSMDWIRSSLFKPTLQEHLQADNQQLLRILVLGQTWQPEQDRKLNALHDLCMTQHPAQKVLIFTQYADTARYLTNELARRQVTQLAYVTGSSDDPTALAHRFSPISNEKSSLAGTDHELRLLVTTDVLSEGQNLQDAHIVVNYDLPWAIIRLIQRAGRVDRIGQRAAQILCYSFLPEEGIEQIINLRSRLTRRIRENAEVVGSDETFFDGDPVNLQDLYHEKSGILDEDEDSEVDLASYAYQIWKNATDADPRLKTIIPNLPNLVYSTKALESLTGVQSLVYNQPGVIVYARTAEENDVLAWVDLQGQLVTQSQLTILRAAQCAADTPPQAKQADHHALVTKALEYVQELESQIGGQLGKKSGVRYRVYTRLAQYYDRDKDTLFRNDPLKRAIDDIYNSPLKEYAREVLNRQLKAGINDDDLANLVIALREEEKLCVMREEEVIQKEPQIICSLGVK